MTCSRRIHLNLDQRAVLAKDRQGAIEVLVVFLFRHIKKVAGHEVGGEVSVAAGSVALCSVPKIKASLGEEFVFKVEARLVDLLVLMGEQCAKKKRYCSG